MKSDRIEFLLRPQEKRETLRPVRRPAACVLTTPALDGVSRNRAIGDQLRSAITVAPETARSWLIALRLLPRRTGSHRLVEMIAKRPSLQVAGQVQSGRAFRSRGKRVSRSSVVWMTMIRLGFVLGLASVVHEPQCICVIVLVSSSNSSNGR